MLPAPKPAGAPNSDDDDDKKPVAVTEVVVTARRLDTARAAVEPSVGASTYTITNDTVENRPGGESTNPTQILLQAPGVAQAGNGQLSVRSQGDLQYRINNVIVADCITDLGDSLSATLVDRVQLVIGALQGQYGLHAGGVVNITTKSSVFDRGGRRNSMVGATVKSSLRSNMGDCQAQQTSWLCSHCVGISLRWRR